MSDRLLGPETVSNSKSATYRQMPPWHYGLTLATEVLCPKNSGRVTGVPGMTADEGRTIVYQIEKHTARTVATLVISIGILLTGAQSQTFTEIHYFTGGPDGATPLTGF